MIIYNVTIKIDKRVETEWLQWMKENHIPNVMKTGMFVEYKLCKMIFEVEEDPQGTTYAVQYIANSLEDIKEYQEKYGKALQEEHAKRYQNRYIAFRTLLEILE